MNLISNGDNEQIHELLKQDELRDFEELSNLTNEIKGYDKIKYVFTPSLARGLEVYTGTIWEVFVNDYSTEITSSIAAGGRYDNIIGKLLNVEETYPAVGMTFVLDVIMEVLRDRGEWGRKTSVDYLLIPMQGAQKAIIEYSDQLRKLGVNVEVDYSGKRIKKILNRANKLDIPYVTIFGEDEVREGKFRVKCMETGMEKELSVSEFENVFAYINPIGLG